MVGIIRLGLVMAVLISGLGSGRASAERPHPYRAAAPVCIALTVTDHLTGPAFTTMRSEASRIWLPHGIALTWTQPVPTTCGAVVPVVFDDAQLSKIAGRKRPDALAVTLFSGSSRTVYVSMPRAFQMVQQLREMTTALATGGERDVRGGTLLGRVVAHELGHVLLETTSHATSGLMRPVFGLSDVLSTDERMTQLSPTDTSRLAMRFSLEPLDGPRPPAVFARRDR